MVADGWMDNSLIAEKTPKLQINYNPIDVEKNPPLQHKRCEWVNPSRLAL